MLVHYKIPLIFVKSFKTASSTSEAFLQAALWGGTPPEHQGWKIERDGFCTFRLPGSHDLRPDQALSIALRGKFPLTSVGRIRRLQHHAMRDEIIPALGHNFWNKSQKIVNIRNPFDWAVSLYYFTFHETAPSDVPPFEDWVLRWGFHPPLRWITEPGQSLTLIRYENLEHDLAKTIESLGIVVPESIPTFKMGIRPRETQDYRAMYTKRSRAHVEDRFKTYLSAFDYSF